MNLLALDTEWSRFDDKEPWKGNVYGDPRPPVCWSWATGEDKYGAKQWDSNAVSSIYASCLSADLVIFFNGKFDIALLRREGVDWTNIKVWDVQLGEFVLSRQTHKFPSLDETCIKYGLPTKLNVVKTEYWDKGVETEDIPWPVLSEYAAYDGYLTLQAYHKQLEQMTPAQRTLTSLMSQDMLILQEMEKNGINYDEQLCVNKSEELDNEISKIKEKLSQIYPHIPINFASGDQLSSFLYGGTIVETVKELDGYFKTGKRAGQPKFKNVIIEHKLPRLFEPVKGSELKKQGFYETNEGVLKKLKGGHKYIVDLLLQLAKLDKLNGTYYKGLPTLNREMHWPKGKLHGTLHQTLARTGRLSSSKPNQQNFASELQDLFTSEFE